MQDQMFDSESDAAEVLKQAEEVIARLAETHDPALCEHLYAAWLRKADTLRAAGPAPHDAALLALDALLAHAGDDPPAPLWPLVAEALIRKIDTLFEADDVGGAITAGQALRTRFGDSQRPEIRVWLARGEHALLVGCSEFGEFARVDAVRHARQAIERYGQDRDPATRLVMARLALQLGDVLEDMEYASAAVEVWEALHARLADAEPPRLREIDAKAMLRIAGQQMLQADAAREAHRDEDEQEDAAQAVDADAQALQAFDRLLARFGADADPAVRAVCFDAERQRIAVLRSSGDIQAALDEYRAMLERHGNDPSPEVRRRLVGIGLEHLQLLAENAPPETVLAACDAFVSARLDMSDPQTIRSVWRALALKRQQLVALGRLDEADHAFAAVLDRHQAHPDPQVRVSLFSHLLRAAQDEVGDSERKLRLYDEVLDRFGDERDGEAGTLAAAAHLGKQGQLIGLHRHGEAVELADAILARFSASDNAETQLMVASAMNDKALALHRQGRIDQMRDTYRAVAARIDLATATPKLREAAALARYRLVRSALDEDNDPATARALAGELAQAHGGDDNPEVRLQVAHGQHSIGYWLLHHDEPAAGLLLFEHVLAATAGEDTGESTRLTHAQTLRNKASALLDLGQVQAAVAVLDGLIAQGGRKASAELRNLLASAQEQRSLYLIKLRTRTDAETELPADAPGPEFDAAFALIDEGDALAAKGDYTGAEARYDQVIVQHADAQHRDLRFLHALALHQKCIDLYARKRYPEVVAGANEMLARHGGERGSRFATLMGRVLLDQAGALGKLGRKDEAASRYEDIAQRYRTQDNPALREHASLALYNRAILLDGSAAPQIVTAAYRDAIDYNIAGATVAMQVRAAKASVNLAMELEAHGQPQAQIDICQRAVAQWSATREPELRKRVARLLELQAQALARLGRDPETLAACKRLLGEYGDQLEAKQRSGIEALQKARRPGLFGRLRGRRD